MVEGERLSTPTLTRFGEVASLGEPEGVPPPLWREAGKWLPNHELSPKHLRR